MRSKKEIDESIRHVMKIFRNNPDERTKHLLSLNLEVGLDIRELLIKKPKGKSREEYEKKFS